MKNPAPDQNTHFLEHVGHMNALQAQAEEMAEPLMFGGCQRGELGIPKMAHPVATIGRGKICSSMGRRRTGKTVESPMKSSRFEQFFRLRIYKQIDESKEQTSVCSFIA
ncbi:hypothetical protein NIA69_22665 [Gemmiger formicilis]|nr:hypothetical protein [Gemmiger formicilis]